MHGTFFYLMGQALAYTIAQATISFPLCLFLSFSIVALDESFTLEAFSFMWGMLSTIVIAEWILKTPPLFEKLHDVSHHMLILLSVVEFALYPLVSLFIFVDESSYLVWIIMLLMHVLFNGLFLSMSMYLFRHPTPDHSKQYYEWWLFIVLITDFVFVMVTFIHREAIVSPLFLLVLGSISFIISILLLVLLRKSK